jgi:antitoxin component YwqK of YwqJK toxin-antitoxin module
VNARPRALAWLGVAALVWAAGACLVLRPTPDPRPPTATHETRRRFHPDGSLARETSVLVWSDGRIERDGVERDFRTGGALASERTYEHDAPVGLVQTWFPDGVLRSEVDFGSPRSPDERRARFWHPNGALAAEGPVIQGIREGVWVFYGPAGNVLRTGGYGQGRRAGLWTFYDQSGAQVARGEYVDGVRVGAWVLRSERGSSADEPE